MENIDVVRTLFDAWNARDMDGLRELYDSNVIVRAPEGWPEPGPWVGPESIMRQWDQMREVWNADTLEPITDFIGAADRVVVRFIWSGTGHGPETDLQLTGIWTVREGRILHTEFFWNHAEALEVMGLDE
ncbi:MAG TPA: nuclear transport factor 2 family protein [Solirubrobacteraceae bacterium]|nr:nuclear transport factor 2 family protein [Solirubrobacteraceae bacterium]